MNSITFRNTFSFLRSFVPEGRWCRNSQDNLKGQHCMLGMIAEARSNRDELGWEGTSNMNELVRLLDRTIPPEALQELKGKSFGTQINGGFIRGFSNQRQRVATFNNTRASEQEITDWLDRAAELAYTEAKPVAAASR